VKIVVDSSLCAGHARCNAYGPDVYELDDRGYCAIQEAEVPPGLQGQARDGADACPEGAITIVS
jgi:ferredoxin